MAYVNNDKLLEALLASHAVGHLTNECYLLFENIVKQRIYKFLKYNRDIHEEAMKTLCMDKLLRVWHSFKFENDNPFAYFVTIIDNSIKLYFIQNQLEYVSIEQQNEKYKKQ